MIMNFMISIGVSMFKKAICIDFDGVIHRYDRGWDKGKIGEPMPGAFEFLKSLCDCEDFEVMIYSSRSCKAHRLAAMKNWFKERYPYANGDGTLPFKFPREKPPAWLTIDDRAFKFEGVFPTTEEIRNFTPWRYRPDDN